MKKITFINFILSSVLFSQTLHFEKSFTFTDELNNTQDLILGYDAYGTNGLDPQLGEEIVPQVSSGNFGARFQLPTDTAIYTIKDFRFGCGQPFQYEHLVDLSYKTGSNTIHIFWDWDFLIWIDFKDPFTNSILAHYEIFADSTHFIIPTSLEKIEMVIQYDGYLTYPSFDIQTPNGGETLVSGMDYDIIWWKNAYYPAIGKLEFSTDAGLTWNIISDTIPSNPNSNNNFTWSVPVVNSDSCLIRVGEYPCYCDLSDSFFSITEPVKVENEIDVLTEFSLSQNYPNPFNPSTKIKFTIPSVGTRDRVSVQLKVYDVLGNEVATLVNEEKPAGEYEVEFTVGQDSSPDIASGIYYYQLKAGSYIKTKKMVLLK